MSVFYLAPALNAQFASGTIRMSVVLERHARRHRQRRTPLPSKAAVIGPCRAILAECPNIDVRTVDVSVPATENQTSQLVDQLLAEVFAPKTDEVIAYRGGHRWTQVFEPMKVDTPSEPNCGLRDEGVYLITGGLGGVGIVLAEGIAQRVPGRSWRCSAVRVCRRARSGMRFATATISRAERIRRVLRMEELGAEVMAFGADVSNLEQMREAIANVERCFGSISGVIHSAGVGGGGIMLLKSREALDAVLQPKIRGTLVLEALLKHRKLDFFLLCSSLNAFSRRGRHLGLHRRQRVPRRLRAFAQGLRRRRRSRSSGTAGRTSAWSPKGWFDRAEGAEGEAGRRGASITRSSRLVSASTAPTPTSSTCRPRITG